SYGHHNTPQSFPTRRSSDLQNAKVIGVAFQGYSGDIAQGVAYMIPTPVINRFLKDVTDKRYDGYVDLGITPLKLQNVAQRKFLRSEEHTSELQSRGHLVCRL